uniref:Aspartate beta-hydroxylase n=1 Tax=Sinocyclocheilus grahami TaxID=75366 RepID=A0A672MRC6_SINGR
MRDKITVFNSFYLYSPGGNTTIKSEQKTEGNSFFSWLLVLALLGVWLSVGVVWFDLVDNNSALGGVYDADGDGDFDVEDAKVLLGLTEKPVTVASTENPLGERESTSHSPHGSASDAEPSLEFKTEESRPANQISPELPPATQPENSKSHHMTPLSYCKSDAVVNSFAAKKKKPKLLNKFDKTIKSEINAAEKLRNEGKFEESLRAFEALVQKFPQSPRCRYGKAQAEDDLAEKIHSNEMLLKAVNTYREVAELPDVPPDLIKATLKRRAERQQFLGIQTHGTLFTHMLLNRIFPEDISLKNDLGVAQGNVMWIANFPLFEIPLQVLGRAPHDGFAKVHYGFILKSENKIAESIPYLREGLESGEPGTDDGRFYFHLGDALQRTGDKSAYDWYEAGHRQGHFASVWQRSLYNVPGLRAQPWWMAEETGCTAVVKMLERNWLTIRDEALSVLDSNSGQFLPEDENLRETGDWGQFTLWQQEATSCKRGQIKFSVMQAGSHVWPHTGPTNCRLRMHLGLIIPSKGCRIQEGKVLIFDDSFEHEVWQEAESYRLIFIVDVWHPELTQLLRQTLSPI